MTPSNENLAAVVGSRIGSSRSTGAEKDGSDDEVHKLLHPVMRTKRCGFILLTIALIASCVASTLMTAEEEGMKMRRAGTFQKSLRVHDCAGQMYKNTDL